MHKLWKIDVPKNDFTAYFVGAKDKKTACEILMQAYPICLEDITRIRELICIEYQWEKIYKIIKEQGDGYFFSESSFTVFNMEYISVSLRNHFLDSIWEDIINL